MDLLIGVVLGAIVGFIGGFIPGLSPSMFFLLVVGGGPSIAIGFMVTADGIAGILKHLQLISPYTIPENTYVQKGIRRILEEGKGIALVDQAIHCYVVVKLGLLIGGVFLLFTNSLQYLKLTGGPALVINTGFLLFMWVSIFRKTENKVLLGIVMIGGGVLSYVGLHMEGANQGLCVATAVYGIGQVMNNYSEGVKRLPPQDKELESESFTIGGVFVGAVSALIPGISTSAYLSATEEYDSDPPHTEEQKIYEVAVGEGAASALSLLLTFSTNGNRV